MVGDRRDTPKDVGTAATSSADGQPAPTERAPGAVAGPGGAAGAGEAVVPEHARSQGRARVELNMGGSETHQRPSFSDPIPPGDPDRVAGGRQVPGQEG